MTLIELLDQLSSRGVHLWADGDRLRVRAPQGALTPALRMELEAHKPALLAQLRSSQHDALTPIGRIPRDGRLPLSFAQQRLWFLAELDPESAAYNIPAAIRITGALDTAIFERALNDVVRRHEVLRTTFRNESGDAVADIHAEMPIAIPIVDICDLGEVRDRAAEHTREKFDLTRGPLLRLSLLRLNPADHVLLFTIHHIASDGWSSRVFMREVTALYDAIRDGRPSPLEALPIQYVDFAAWQREWLQGERLERQLSYWRAKLDALPTVDWPTDRTRPAMQTFNGASMQFTIASALADRLKHLAREQGATLFQVLLSAFAVLMHHVTGADDLPIGSPVVNRGRRELEALIGFFVNTVILRIDVSGQPTVADLLRRVRETTLDAYAHQDLPFEQLVADLQPLRDLSRHALFQTVFVLQDNPVEREEIAGLTLRQMDVPSWHVKFDLVVNAWDSQAGLVVWWEYNSDLFDADTIAALFTRFERVLTAIADAPTARIDQIEILSADEMAVLDADPRIDALGQEFAFSL